VNPRLLLAIASFLTWTGPEGARAAAPVLAEFSSATPSAGRHFTTSAKTSALDRYYVLQRADTPAGPWDSIAMKLGTASALNFSDPASMGRRAYYRTIVWPRASPIDSDADGRNDLLEWQAGDLGNPFNAAPACAPTDGAIILLNEARFEALAHRDNFPGASDVREVKFLITSANTATPRLYFFNTQVHSLHYAFAQTVLGYTQSLQTFNSETYFTDTRRQIAGSLVYYPHYSRGNGSPPGLFAVEFWPSDIVSFRHVRMAYLLISAAMPWMDRRLAYHPASISHDQRMALEANQWRDSFVDRLSSTELFANTAYSVLNPGVSYGRLILGGGTTAVTSRDIVVLPTIPADLSRVAGIISAAPQTPLSHINLKAKQNNTPNCYLRSALTDPQITALLGKNVRFEVGSDGILLREATATEVDTYLNALRPTTPSYPPRDLTVTSIRSLDSIGFADSTNAGAKAANLAELLRILPAGMAPSMGFSLPFSFYDRFMTENGFYAHAAAMIANPAFQTDPVAREAQLAIFRSLILQGTVSAADKALISAAQSAFPLGTPIRCRSSTNNEDLPGFNGAGLYDSYTHRPDEGSLHKTVRKVWASLWNFRAFEERDFYRIDHFQAAMAVLLMPNTDDELANGVAVSKNLIDPNWQGYYVNVQKGEALVTNPDSNVVPEEFLIANLEGFTRYEIQHVTYSSLQPPGVSLLTTAQAWALADQLAVIQAHFQPLYQATGNPAFAMEVEFKITKDNQLYIKQARPWVD
jgi:pyruvate, water dikinase